MEDKENLNAGWFTFHRERPSRYKSIVTCFYCGKPIYYDDDMTFAVSTPFPNPKNVEGTHGSRDCAVYHSDCKRKFFDE